MSDATKDIRIRLEKLHADRGELLLDDIVDDARPEDSPLHAYFEWDDDKASEAFRLFQAGCLVRSVRIQYEAVTPTGPMRVRIRQYHSTHEGRAAYRKLNDLLNDPDDERALLARFERDAAAFQRRWAGLAAYRDWLLGQI